VTPPNPTRTGVLYGLAAYVWWGFIALYFKAVASVPPLEVLSHRILWSALLLMVLLRMRGELVESLRSMLRRRTLLTLLATTSLIALNWFVFIWAVGHQRVLDASLGYFINPLVNVLLGVALLHEALRPAQKIALLLAVSGVLLLSSAGGHIPWVAFILALSFSLYGFLRKQVAVGGVVGLCAETLLLSPWAALFLAHAARQGSLAVGHQGTAIDLLLAASGLVTALPLVWFTNAARRLPYSTVGFLQYIAPSLQFLLAVFLFHEPFGLRQLLSFALIWSALGVFSWELFTRSRLKA